MKDEADRLDTRVQGRVDVQVKKDLYTIGSAKGHKTLGGFVAHILTKYRDSQKRKGKC